MEIPSQLKEQALKKVSEALLHLELQQLIESLEVYSETELLFKVEEKKDIAAVDHKIYEIVARIIAASNHDLEQSSASLAQILKVELAYFHLTVKSVKFKTLLLFLQWVRIH